VLPDEYSLGVKPNQLAKWRASRKCCTLPLVAATIAVAVNKPIPGIDSKVVQAGLCLASMVSSRSSCAIRASSKRISSTSKVMVPRIKAGTAECGSDSTRLICSMPLRLPAATEIPNSRQNPRSALMRLLLVAALFKC
jgi:hypothetical protein